MTMSLSSSGQDRLIFQVSLPSITQSTGMNPRRTQSDEFNTAVWLHFPRGLWKSISLHVKYRDKERLKTILVDRCLGTGQSVVLLNGCVKIAAVGNLKAAGLFVKGLEEDEPVKVEECSFSPRQQPETALAAAPFRGNGESRPQIQRPSGQVTGLHSKI